MRMHRRAGEGHGARAFDRGGAESMTFDLKAGDRHSYRQERSAKGNRLK